MQRKFDGFYDVVHFVHDLVIPKSNDCIAHGLQEFGSFGVIFFLLQVLRPKGVPSNSMTNLRFIETKSTI